MAASDAQGVAQRLQKWADGKATLKEVRGYSDEELYSIARMGYFFFYQGKREEARTIFQGLYAVNPLDPYFAKALGVVEMAAGNPVGALAAYDVCLKLSPRDSAAYVGRAEVRIAQNQRAGAVEDLRRAAQHVEPTDPLREKIAALLQRLSRR
ncbi:MAG: CesD/SycD/LcrH family type III secretion system chaperone [Myxococcaceae bacterium]|jgi:type III secretion system low calcium response chaperone LcrH/SycD|nr:CesD/SycD/LcrH family type III secretion system chaperone [Myxococcaceae bacterium]MCA3014978.1 CesD/SycD/LcrH family type III secretion system chaperone [Myxococcaceae bacterium]